MSKELTEQMFNDYKPYVKDFALFKQDVLAMAAEYGTDGVQRIDEVPFPDGRPGIMEKHYFLFYDPEFPDYWDFTLNAVVCGVDSL